MEPRAGFGQVSTELPPSVSSNVPFREHLQTSHSGDEDGASTMFPPQIYDGLTVLTFSPITPTF